MKELIAQNVHYTKFIGEKELPKSLGENDDSQKNNVVEKYDERFYGQKQAFEDAASISLKVWKYFFCVFLLLRYKFVK
jgi:hypothetical protein